MSGRARGGNAQPFGPPGGRGRGRVASQAMSSMLSPSQIEAPHSGIARVGNALPSGTLSVVRQMEETTLDGYGRARGGNAPLSGTPSVVRQMDESTRGGNAPLSGTPSVVKQMEELTVTQAPKDTKAVKRPDVLGDLGKECFVKANKFSVELICNNIYQYDITISPTPIKSKCRKIIEHLINECKASDLGGVILSYDGKNSVFAAGRLPFDSKTFAIKTMLADAAEKEEVFNVTVKLAAIKDLKELDHAHEIVQALDVVLREAVSGGQKIIGRSVFSCDNRGPLGNGIEYWKGFYHSIRPIQMGLSLTVDISAMNFYQEKLVSEFVSDFLKKEVSSRPLSNEDRNKVARALLGVCVEVCCSNYSRRYTVRGVTEQPTSTLNFPENGTQRTVIEYFKSKYNVTVQYRSLPAIQAGTADKPIWLPMEICRIVKGQRCKLKLNKNQVVNFLKATCQRPTETEESIKKIVSADVGMRVSNQLTSISSQLTSCDARLLSPPHLCYRVSEHSARSPYVLPIIGQWNMNGLKMIDGGKVNDWAILNLSNKKEHPVRRFVERIVQRCKDRGMECCLQPKRYVTGKGPLNSISITRYLDSLIRDFPNLHMLFVILPSFERTAERIYPIIKRVCETVLGIISQCCNPEHVASPGRDYIDNIVLKVNLKVGGRNTVMYEPSIVHFFRDPTIFFGVTILRTSPGENSSLSVAAVAASMDLGTATKYKALVSVQPHMQDYIDGKDLIKDLLYSYHASTKRKPLRIIFYRDGDRLDEGKFNEVLLREMDQIHQACSEVEKGYLPPVTFVVAKKNHRTRFFPVESTDLSGNVVPGTVVDSKICHPTDFDFYLCSHAGIQGTSRPAHYHVLYDENSFTANGMQILTNCLCYTYQRCTRSVSIVPPVYYARLAAVRAQTHMEGSDRPPDPAIPVIHDNVKEVMYYC